MAANPGDDTIYLVGTSGHPNYGDEFITAAWLKHLAAARPDAEIWLDCHSPGQAAHLFDGLHPRLHFTDTLFRVVWESKELPRGEADHRVRQHVRDLGTPRFDLGLLALRRASTVHFLGGGYINNRWPFHVGLLHAAAELREISDVRLVATGLGLTPPGDEDSLLEALKSFDHVTVRDTPSAALTGARLAPDDAFLGVRELPSFGSEPTADQDGDVWVCLQHDLASEDTFDAVVEATRAALTAPGMEGRTVRYLEALPGVDRVAYERLADLIPEDNFTSFVRLWHEGFPAAPGQTWFTTRFHVHLLAALSGAHGAALEINEDYYRVKHASLVDLGTGWSVTPAGSTTVAAPSVSKGFPYKSRTVSQDKLDEAAALYPKVSAPEPVQEASPAAPRKGRGWRSRW
jgi:hypothetical protein